MAVSWVLGGYSELYSGFQTAIFCIGIPIQNKITAWKTRVLEYPTAYEIGVAEVCVLFASIPNPTQILCAPRFWGKGDVTTEMEL